MPSSITPLLRRVCEFFDLGPLVGFTDAGGHANQNLVIESGKGTYFAKILREHDPDALKSEASYLVRLASMGFPSPSYLVGRDGGCLYQGEDQFVALMPFLKGEVSDSFSLARLHRIDKASLTPRKTWWQAGYLGAGLVRAKQRFGDQALSRLEIQIAALTELAAENLPRSIAHGDPWPGNALFDGERLAALVDWEETTLGFPVFDLAYLALHGCASDGDFNPRKFQSLIESYQSVRELAPSERRCFGQAVRRVACTNYLWLILKAAPDRGGLEALWATEWYRGLELDRLTLTS